MVHSDPPPLQRKDRGAFSSNGTRTTSRRCSRRSTRRFSALSLSLCVLRPVASCANGLILKFLLWWGWSGQTSINSVDFHVVRSWVDTLVVWRFAICFSQQSLVSNGKKMSCASNTLLVDHHWTTSPVGNHTKGDLGIHRAKNRKTPLSAPASGGAARPPRSDGPPAEGQAMGHISMVTQAFWDSGPWGRGRARSLRLFFAGDGCFTFFLGNRGSGREMLQNSLS